MLFNETLIRYLTKSESISHYLLLFISDPIYKLINIKKRLNREEACFQFYFEKVINEFI